MLARESVRIRLESEHGISYTEFSYMLLQANDYLWLHDHLGCELQIGGSDQCGQHHLRRRPDPPQAPGAPCTPWPGRCSTAADGSKLGKTTGARLWLDPAKTSPYQFHQHWMQLDDRQLDQQLKFFSLRPLAEIDDVLAAHADGAGAARRPSGRSPTT